MPFRTTSKAGLVSAVEQGNRNRNRNRGNGTREPPVGMAVSAADFPNMDEAVVDPGEDEQDAARVADPSFGLGQFLECLTDFCGCEGDENGEPDDGQGGTDTEGGRQDPG